MEDEVEQYTILDPWIYGPYELIQHAEGHLKANGDFDRRMALISYDNAIELTITTFLKLSPSMRDGQRYEEQQVKKWLENFHSRLEFFDQYVTSHNQQMRIPKKKISWYHMHRNDLYHDGKGLVPEERILKGIRAAALYVFSTLFDINGEELLKDPPKLKGAEKTGEAMQAVSTGKKIINGKGSDTRIVNLKAGLAVLRLKYKGKGSPTFYLYNEEDRIVARINSNFCNCPGLLE